MSLQKVASRYAQSLIDLAIEQNSLDKVREDMLFLQQVCHVSREFVNLLRNPVVHADKKVKILEKVGAGRMTPIIASFVRLLINKGREEYLPEIIDAFLDQYNNLKDIHTLKLTTAVEVGEGVRQALKDKIRQDLGLDKTVLQTAVNADLVGGFTLEFDGKMVDASIAKDLRDVRKEFTLNYYVPKLSK